MHDDFCTTLNLTLDRCDRKIHEVAFRGNVDTAYLRKLSAGEKWNPSPETLRKIWIGCIFDPRILERHPEMIHGLAELAQAAVLSAGSLSAAAD